MYSVNAKVALTSDASKQCARWDCSRSTSEAVYCRESCLALVTSDAQSRLPACTTDVYASAAKFVGVASKLLKSLRDNTESGIPQLLSPDLLQIPPWESGMFDYDFADQRVDYCNWIFTGLSPIPNSTTTSGFKWEGGGRVKMIGEVRHCVFKPSPGQDRKWKLHQFSSPDLMGKAVYLMHCDR
ncbi:unnamed protein product [Microthlaspi erraticum]|uniref:Uncharacterized protein n=1 Tax=Microthlaspi erraticum TaxID=1685480 RepID=A0A6D2JWL7_9BRAS|nr:unnamed protein product [Microthlaspi erraticum]